MSLTSRHVVTRATGAVLLSALALVSTACPPSGGGGGGTSDMQLVRAHSVGTEPQQSSWHDSMFGSASKRQMSADGRYVVYGGETGVNLFDSTTGDTTTIDADDYDSAVTISGDGDTVVWQTDTAPPLYRGDVDVHKYDVATGDVDTITVPLLPEDYEYAQAVYNLSVADDGTVAWITHSAGPGVWDENGVRRLSGGSATGGIGGNAGLSPSGEFFAVVSEERVDTGEVLEEFHKVTVRVWDLDTDAIVTTWETAPRNMNYPCCGANAFVLHHGGTFDDGSVIFSYTSNAGVFRLAPNGSVAQIAGYENTRVHATSRNGRYVGFTGPAGPLGLGGWVNELTDVNTAATVRVSGYNVPGVTAAIAVSDDGTKVLVYTSEPGRASQPGLWIWTRG